MKILSYGHDGGAKSNVTGFWFIELKWLFSIVILRFGKGSREAFHSHAFNAITWFIWGRVTEYHVDGRKIIWKPSFKPKWTPRSCFHKVYADQTTYALSIRGPWDKTWKEYVKSKDETTLFTYGREIINQTKGK